MPSSIKFNDFSAGWIPSDDQINGRKNGLLRMDGATLDENGALIMSAGTKRHATVYPAIAHTLYSKYVCGTKRRYLGLMDGSVYRDATAIVAAAAGSLTRAAFGVLGDFVLIATGKTLIKDDCAGIVSDLILEPPVTAPLITANLADVTDSNWSGTFANFVASQGAASVGAGPTLRLDTTTLVGSIFTGYYIAAASNSNVADFPKDLSGSDNDIFQFSTLTNSYSQVASLQINLYMSATQMYTLLLLPSDFTKVPDANGVITFSKRRSDFIRNASDGDLTWANIIKCEVIVKTTSPPSGIFIALLGFNLYNNTNFPLTGTYTWLQVNVLKSGSLETKSIAGPESVQVTLQDSSAEVIPEDPTIIEPDANEIWIYRRGGDLPDFYRVKRMLVSAYAPFTDNLSDSDALDLGIILNTDLLTVDDTNLEDDILEIVGPVNGRMLYFTTNDLLFTPPNQPDSFDPNLTIKIAGSEGEIFYWARKVSENLVLVGTSHDVYTLTGSYITQPDGTLDVYYRPIGIDKPPVCRDVTVYKTSVIYFAAFGWIMISTNGDHTPLTVPGTDLLYTGVTRYEYGGVPTVVSGSFRYSVCISRDKFYGIVPVISDYDSDSTINDDSTWTRRLESFDLLKKYWRPLTYAPVLLYTEEDGNIIGFMDDKRLNSIEYPFTKALNFIP